MPRRFAPPWSLEELNDACFVVRDQNSPRTRRGQIDARGFLSRTVVDPLQAQTETAKSVFERHGFNFLVKPTS
jgi:hypothetical protein